MTPATAEPPQRASLSMRSRQQAMAARTLQAFELSVPALQSASQPAIVGAAVAIEVS